MKDFLFNRKSATGAVLTAGAIILMFGGCQRSTEKDVAVMTEKSFETKSGDTLSIFTVQEGRRAPKTFAFLKEKRESNSSKEQPKQTWTEKNRSKDVVIGE
jgi:hypothetical protein